MIRRILLVGVLLQVFAPVLRAAPTNETMTLESLKASYRSSLKAIVDSPFPPDSLKYGDSLDALAAVFQKKGDLDGLIAAKNEKKRFDQEKTVPEESTDDLPPVIVKARQDHRKALVKSRMDRNRQILALVDKYAANLETLKIQLTRQGRIEDALAVREEIGRVRSSAEVTAAQFELADDSTQLVAPVPIRKTICRRAAQPVSIDGKLDEPIWARGEPSSDFALKGEAGLPEVKTRFRTAYDDRTFYVAVECDEPATPGIVARETKRDGEVWSDDEVEMFVDTTRDRKTYFHFMLGAGGVRYDARQREEKLPWGDVKWNGAWTGKTAIGNDRWTAEFAIPFETMGARVPKPGETWGLNVARHRAQAPEEFSSWCSGGFHAPELFKDLVFE